MRYGSLFSGYGGLDLGLQSVLGGSTAWHVEFDKHPSAILAHHWPDVPNHGDITKIDFTAVEPVDVLTGGFPCQDVSHAGRRAGLIRDGEGRTRSGLWGEMLRAITELRPRLVVAENVRGLLSAAADSDVEPCPWCLGDANGEPDMRALGAVLADLADVGFDAWWVGLRAADVGAAHGRFRVFIFAVPQDAPTDAQPLPLGEHGAARGVEAETPRRIQADGYEARAGAVGGGSLGGGGQAADSGQLHARRRLEGDDQCATNPSPASPAGTMTPSTSSAPTASPRPSSPSPQHSPTLSADLSSSGLSSQSRWPSACPDGNGRGKSLAIEAQRLLPTPRATDGTKGGPNQRGSSGDLMLPSAVQLLPTPSVADVEGGRKHRSGDRSDELLLNGLAAKWGEEARLLPTPRTENNENRQSVGYGGNRGNFHGLVTGSVSWGDYAPAIARWETVIGRPAPEPTEPGPKGNPRLSAHFVEWMMGLPLGWVTDVDIPRNAQLKALGNGVVPQQAAAACRWWLAQIERTAA